MAVHISDIYMALRFWFQQNADYSIRNAYVYNWESDFLSCTKAGLHIETEIKCSRADFKADFKKTHKHYLLSRYKESNSLTYRGYESTHFFDENGKYHQHGFKQCDVQFGLTCEHIPNRFWYACPEGLLTKEEMPPYAGLLYVCGCHAHVVKQAPKLHSNKQDWRNVIIGKMNARLYQFEYRNYLQQNQLPFGSELATKPR